MVKCHVRTFLLCQESHVLAFVSIAPLVEKTFPEPIATAGLIRERRPSHFSHAQSEYSHSSLKDYLKAANPPSPCAFWCLSLRKHEKVRLGSVRHEGSTDGRGTVRKR